MGAFNSINPEDGRNWTNNINFLKTTMKFSWKRLNSSTMLILYACIALILLRFLLHYLELGFFEFIIFDLLPKWLLLLLPVVIFFYKLRNKSMTYSIVADFAITGITFYLVYFAMNSDNLDSLDWKINYNRRQKIVRLAKEKKLKNVGGITYKIPFTLTLFPYIKSNDVIINYQNDTALTVMFYTDRGLVDHYSAFIYSNDSTQIQELEEKVMRGGNDFKKEANWYFIHD